MKKTSNMKASNMKRVLLTLALLAGLSTMSYAQTYREITNTKLIINSSYPSGNALTLRTGAGQAAYTLTLPASAPANGDILRVDPSTANTLIWTSPLDMYVFENGLTESGTNTVKWGGALTGATIINTAGSNAITFYNNTAASTAAMTIGGGAGTLTLDVRGGTTINTSGTANTSIGNATGTFELNSAALDVSTAGAISGVTTINMSGALTNTGISNQIVLGTGTTVTLTAPTPAANAVYTIPDVGATGSFVLTTGSQTITGAKTFSTAVTVTDNTASTSTSTGALIVTGGIGSGGRLNVAGNTSLEGDVALGNAGADALTINAATVTAANLPTTGASTHRIVVSNAGALVTGSVATIIGDHAWMVGGNTITGGSTTRKIGINTQASNDDALAIMTDGQDRLTISSTGNSTFTGTVTLNTGADPDLTIAEAGITRAGNIAITSSAGGVTITKGTASAIVNDDVNISRTGTSTTQAIIIDNGQLTLSSESNATPATSKVASVQISNTAPSVSIIATNAAGTSSNTFAVAPDGTSSLAALTLGDATTSGSARIHDGSGGTEGILVTSGLSADRTYTMDVDADASFVMSAGTQTIGGAKTFSAATAIEGDLTLGTGTSATGGSIILNDDATGNSFTATVKAANHAASRTYTLDDISADASFVMTAGTQTIGGAKTFSGAASFGSTLEVAGATTLNGNVTLGNAAADVVTITGTIAGASPLVFEGATSNAFQTTFAITDPTADRTITFPDVDGTVITTGNADDLIWKIGGNTITGASTTRKIGINTQATNADGLALMTSGTDRLTISSAGNSTFTGTVTLNTGANPDLTIDEAGITRAGAIAITSTSAGITLTKGNGSITLAGGDDVSLSRTGTSTTQSVTLDNSTLTLSSETNSGGSKSASIQISNATPSVTFAVTNAAGTSTNVVTITATATTADTDVSITATTTSTSSTTGALKVSGGAGINENLFVGGTLNATGNTLLSGTLGVTGATSLNGNATLGDNASDVVTVTGTIAGATPLVFEGATANGFETSFAITDPTAARTITFPDETGTVITTGNLGSITGFVPYNTTSALTTADANGTAYLFNVAYDGAATGNALGARIASDATGGTNASATGLTLSAVGTGTGTATGLTVSASGPGTNKAINVTAGGIDVDAGGLNVDAGGITVTGTSSIDGATTITGGDLTLGAAAATSGGSIVLHDDDNTTSFTATVKAANHAASRTYSIPDAGAAASFVMTEGNQTLNGQTTLAATTTFQSALKFPFIRNTTAGAYTVAANDFVVIQTVNGAINLPAGVDGRMLILKNTAAGATINITPNGAQTCDAATLAEGASITLIYNSGNWYQVGN
jgi:hypothetical protein